MYLGVVCDRDERDPDGPDACGCALAFAGLNSHAATTTAEIGDEYPIGTVLGRRVDDLLVRGPPGRSGGE